MFVYRWFDPADNDVHYLEIAPQNLPYEMIAIANEPPVDLDVQRRLAEMDQHADERIEARNRRREAARLEQQQLRPRAKWTTRAFPTGEPDSKIGQALKMLVIGAEGTARRMTEAERQDKNGCSESTDLNTLHDRKIARRCPLHRAHLAATHALEFDDRRRV